MMAGIPFVGIDFGTFSSKIAWYNPDTRQAEIIAPEGETQTPSVVYFGESEMLVGAAALKALEDEQESARGVMRVKRQLPNPSIALPGRTVKPVEVVAEILRKLKRDAEAAHFQQEITHAVITYPTTFDSIQQDILREAAVLAGFTEVYLLKEPIAAALACLQLGLKASNPVLVYDLGAATFHLVLLEQRPDEQFLHVLKSDHDDYGGDDFDDLLYDACNAVALKKLGRQISLTDKRDLSFLRLCRMHKERLSYAERRWCSARLKPDFVLFEHDLKRSMFEELISQLVEQTVSKTNKLLGDARRAGYTVDILILVGGSAHIPLVHKMLEQQLSLTLYAPQQRHTTITLGAAYYAYHLWKPENQYRTAVQVAWQKGRLDEADFTQLVALEDKLSIGQALAEALERQIMPDTKEAIIKRQRALVHYQHSVQRVKRERRFDEESMKQLAAEAAAAGISSTQASAIERKILDDTKENILAHQQALTQYRQAVAAITDKKLERVTLERLTALATSLHLSKDEAESIERDALRESKEIIFAYQQAREQYREEVQAAWSNKQMERKKLERLDSIAARLPLSLNEIEAIECEVMGKSRKAAFEEHMALDEYRLSLLALWSDKSMDRKKLLQLFLLADRLKLSDTQIEDAERAVLGDIKESIFVTQRKQAAKKSTGLQPEATDIRPTSAERARSLDNPLVRSVMQVFERAGESGQE